MAKTKTTVKEKAAKANASSKAQAAPKAKTAAKKPAASKTAKTAAAKKTTASKVVKVEVYNLMNELVKNGAAVIMISSEMDECMGMSDRIMVMHEGRITAEFTAAEATQEKILYAASGITAN